MKTLTVSFKTGSQFMADLKRDLKLVAKKKASGTKYEISFDDKKSFDKFVKNIALLSLIHREKPQSVYELAKMANLDVSNLNKIILFFESIGVITLKRTMISGRSVTQPLVEYENIQFNLAAL